MRHAPALMFVTLLSAASSSWANQMLMFEELNCIDSPNGSCDFGSDTESYPVFKGFSQPGPLTVTGYASGMGPSNPFVETVSNFTGMTINNYMLTVANINGNGFNGVGFTPDVNGDGLLRFAAEDLTSSAGTCSLMYGNRSILCAGVNVAHSASFDVSFKLTTDELLTRYHFEIEQGPTERTVPEPTALALFSLGLVGIGAVRRKKRTAWDSPCH